MSPSGINQMLHCETENKCLCGSNLTQICTYCKTGYGNKIRLITDNSITVSFTVFIQFYVEVFLLGTLTQGTTGVRLDKFHNSTLEVTVGTVVDIPSARTRMAVQMWKV